MGLGKHRGAQSHPIGQLPHPSSGRVSLHVPLPGPITPLAVGLLTPPGLKVPEIRPRRLSSHGVASPQLCLAHGKGQQINFGRMLAERRNIQQ